MSKPSICTTCKRESLNCKCYVFYPEPSKQLGTNFSERLMLNKALTLLRECREHLGYSDSQYAIDLQDKLDKFLGSEK